MNQLLDWVIGLALRLQASPEVTNMSYLVKNMLQIGKKLIRWSGAVSAEEIDERSYSMRYRKCRYGSWFLRGISTGKLIATGCWNGNSKV